MGAWKWKSLVWKSAPKHRRHEMPGSSLNRMYVWMFLIWFILIFSYSVFFSNGILGVDFKLQ